MTIPDFDAAAELQFALHLADLLPTIAEHTVTVDRALATADLAGVCIEDVLSRGKHLLFRLDDGRTLHTHFRMDGSWHLYRPGAQWRGGPSHGIRVVLSTSAWTAVGYRLPVVTDCLAR